MVEQFHYLQWPDHDVPRNPSQLLCLVEMVNKSGSESPTGPVLVHCRYWDGSALVLEQGWPGLYQPLSCVLSAGIGRTGTFIALDFLLKMAKAEGKVDVFHCVQKLREQRICMVQTKVRGITSCPRAAGLQICLPPVVCQATSAVMCMVQSPGLELPGDRDCRALLSLCCPNLWTL